MFLLENILQLIYDLLSGLDTEHTAMTPHIDAINIIISIINFVVIINKFGTVSLVIAYTQYLLKLEYYRWLHV